MGFSQEQVNSLSAKLDKTNVKTRQQGGRDLSYVEGWHVIAEANRIYGFDGWERETVYLKEVCRYDFNGKHKVGYEAKVRVTAGGVSREGTGTGSGIAKDLYDAIEGAAKEAETDAMKRAFMTFGNPFGLALYDKDQKDVANAEVLRFTQALLDCSNMDELKVTWDEVMSAGLSKELVQLKDQRKAELSQ